MMTARSLLAIAIAGACIGSGQAMAQTVVGGPIQNPSNGHWYMLLQNSTIADARAAAAGLGGYLTSISDGAENEWVRANMANFNGVGRRLWIGLTDEAVEGTFVWMNGEPVNYTNWQQNPFQPDNNLGRDPVNGEDYVEMITPATGEWNDQPGCCNLGVQQAIIFPCIEFNTQPTFGACCASTACSVTTPTGCANASGIYRGDGTNCQAIYNGAMTSGPFTPGLPIGPDAGTVTVDTETLNGAASIGGMSVNIQIQHTFIGDLTIDLRNDSTGTTVRLFNRLCAGNDNMSVTFIDGGATLVCATPTSGTYAPFEALSAFNGQSAMGTWTLTITDGANIDGGTLDSWTVTTFNSVTPSICSLPACGTADFDGDGDTGTDADIESFFACLSGNCCATCFSGGADFDLDGDTGTDADIEAFFRVLAGGNC